METTTDTGTLEELGMDLVLINDDDHLKTIR